MAIVPDGSADDLVASLTEAREEQISAIARRLHDGPIQLLTALTLRLGLLRRHDPDEHSELAEIERLALRAIEGLRNEMEELRAPDEFAASTSEAIGWLLTRAGVAGRIEVRAEGAEPPPLLRAALFRMCQQLVRGGHLDGDAVRGTITLSTGDRAAELAVPVGNPDRAHADVAAMVRAAGGTLRTDPDGVVAGVTISVPIRR